MNVLNLPDARKSVSIARELNKAALRLYGEHVTESGVNYAAMAASESFLAYRAAAEQLHLCDLGSLEEADRLAFLLNVYNALVIHGMVSLGVPSSPLANEGFFRNTAYRIGAHDFSLDDIEHGLLRGNQPHPSGKIFFSEQDPRLAWSLKKLDPRVHFALVCGAKSCPPIRLFTPERTDAALEAAARGFVSAETLVQPPNRVTLSSIFKWYGADFGATPREQLERIATWLPEDRAAELREVAKHPDLQVEYTKYNWETNQN